MPFDVVIATDLRYPGGSSHSTLNEIRALRHAGYKVALVPIRSARLNPSKRTNPWLQMVIDRGIVSLVDPSDQAVDARLAILRNPYGLDALIEPSPRLHAAHNILVVNHPPINGYGVPCYDPRRVSENCKTLTGKDVVWAPNSPLVRRMLETTPFSGAILNEDWPPILFFGDLAADRQQPVKEIPVIGRHSRPVKAKWPATREAILTIYPDDPSIEVRILGFGDVPQRIVGEIPSNWVTFAFNEVLPAEFLGTIDFFVFYHHPSWIEAIGRGIAEALGSGAVAILPQYFRVTYGDAALYRAAADVIPTVRELYGNWKRYTQQSRLGQEIAKQLFSPQRFIDRIRRFIGDPT